MLPSFFYCPGNLLLLMITDNKTKRKKNMIKERSVGWTPNGLFNASLCSFTTYWDTTKEKENILFPGTNPNPNHSQHTRIKQRKKKIFFSWDHFQILHNIPGYNKGERKYSLPRNKSNVRNKKWCCWGSLDFNQIPTWLLQLSDKEFLSVFITDQFSLESGLN